MVHEVHDPVVHDLCPGVEAALDLTIQGERGFGRLEDQHRVRGMARQIVPGRSGHHGDVRLRLRFLVQGDGKLDPHSPAGPEGRPQGVEGKLDGRRVRRPLRLPDNELATDQLDAVARLEDTAFDEPVVLQARPALGRQGLRHVTETNPT
jgi:hypothetical protein